ncbi:spore germination protein [Virgibacillus dakarensis]|uniref:Stage V sporulation protein AF n=1 Tax=Lentibacillus populi TaxID=1827502 RepID=A0A9W5TVQ1_9BACI|nr:MULTISPECIES: spore germination protein [Bacillaceae]MBT2214319.1 spore germination protein [Virgibacillus dakarensis]MTW84996.1 spore germination protein [Virgibacillus dakarensis]GGB33908.1 stage V sporulation protein AF [Lentibacillus populi]
MAETKENKSPISPDIKDTEAYMKKHIGIGVSFDAGFREITVLKTKIQLYYVNGLVDSSNVIQIMKVLVQINDNEGNRKKVREIVENRLVHQQVAHTKSMDEVVDQMLSGLIVIFVDGEKEAFIIDVRHYPGRTPEEPDTEHVVRGSRDGYTENVIENTSLTRRRIRDERLRNEMLKVGERSKMDICISYLQDVVDDGLVKLIKEKIREVEIDGMSMADKTLEEFIIKSKWNPYPMVRYTERPDVAAHHILEGHVIIIVDTSPSVIILPTTVFHHLQHAEEYRQRPAVGTFIRLIRFLAVLLSIFLLPLWLLFAMEPTLLPDPLSYIGPNEKGNIPIYVQIILGIVGVEFLRMAAIHTPTPLSTAMGLIAAVLIGQIAIDVGMLSPEVILYVSVSAIGAYVTPSYELSVANKMVSLFLVLLTAIFGLIGLAIGVTVFILFIVNLKSLRTPYFWPFIPFNAKALKNLMIRVPVPYDNSRPSIVHPRNTYRQPLYPVKKGE